MFCSKNEIVNSQRYELLMGWGWPKCFRTYGHKMDREFAKARLSNGLGAKMTSNVCSKNEKGICKVRLRNWLGAKMF